MQKTAACYVLGLFYALNEMLHIELLGQSLVVRAGSPNARLVPHEAGKALEFSQPTANNSVLRLALPCPFAIEGLPAQKGTKLTSLGPTRLAHN